MECVTCDLSGCDMLAWDAECCLCVGGEMCRSCEQFTDFTEDDYFTDREDYDGY